MPILTGKQAIVTGGTRGIGRAVVERLARDGAHVVFGYRERHQDAKAVEAAVAEAGGRAHGVQVDLAQPGAVRRLFAEAAERLDGLDILVANAAVSAHTPIAETTDEEYDRIMAVNAKSVFQTLREAARSMRDGGRIIIVSSLSTVVHGEGTAAYAGSKGAVEQFAKVAAQELGPRGITVNSVLPGATDTDMLRSNNLAEYIAAAAAQTSLGRLGRPEDVADAIATLVGPDGHWITGQAIHATGGLGG